MAAPGPVCILGCGRTARAMCAYLAEQGVEVALWGREKERVRALCEEGISVTGCVIGRFHPEPVTDLADTARFPYLFVMTTAEGHLPLAKGLQGHLGQEQHILIFNGNWGACQFYSVLREEARRKHAVISETGAMIFLADYVGENLHIKRIKDNIAMASIPSGANEAALARLRDMLPQLVGEENVLCTSINNSNPVIHTPVTLFNFTRVENGEDHLFYAQGATASVIRYIERIDEERCRVAAAVGARVQTCLEIINSFWPEKYDNLYDAIRRNQAYMTGKGPATLRYRYITEDVPFGMAAVAALGRRYGVETPYIDAMLCCYDGLIDGLRALTPDFSSLDLEELY